MLLPSNTSFRPLIDLANLAFLYEPSVREKVLRGTPARKVLQTMHVFEGVSRSVTRAKNTLRYRDLSLAARRTMLAYARSSSDLLRARTLLEEQFNDFLSTRKDQITMKFVELISGRSYKVDSGDKDALLDYIVARELATIYQDGSAYVQYRQKNGDELKPEDCFRFPEYGHSNIYTDIYEMVHQEGDSSELFVHKALNVIAVSEDQACQDMRGMVLHHIAMVDLE